MPRKKKTTNTEAVTMAADTMAIQAPVMPLADTQSLAVVDHTSRKLITDEEAMERLGQAVDIAVQRAEDAIPAAGINLVVGSRNWNKASVFNEYFAGYGIGGFGFIQPYEIVNKESGFSEIVLSSTASRAYTSVSLEGITEETTSFTISIEICSDSPNDVDYNSVFFAANIYRKSSLIGKTNELSLSSLGINRENLISGKWVKLVMHIDAKGFNNSDSLLITITGRPLHLKCRKLAVYPGNISNPTWSASPFDVAQETQIKPWLGLVPDESISTKVDVNDLYEPKVYLLRGGSENSLNKPNNATEYGFVTNINPFNDNRRIQFWLNWNDNINNIHLYGRIRAQEKTYGDWKLFF